MFNRLRSFTRAVADEINVYRLVLQDRRTPWIAKILLGAAVAYLLSPIDIIPDFIPVLGQLDDLIIVPLLVYLALLLIPSVVIRESREKIAGKSR